MKSELRCNLFDLYVWNKLENINRKVNVKYTVDALCKRPVFTVGMLNGPVLNSNQDRLELISRLYQRVLNF